MSTDDSAGSGPDQLQPDIRARVLPVAVRKLRPVRAAGVGLPRFLAYDAMAGVAAATVDVDGRVSAVGQLPRMPRYA